MLLFHSLRASFITFRSCQHLDSKHTIFGRVVGGLETLKLMEALETDNKDVPISPITIEKTNIFVNPFKEVDDQVCVVVWMYVLYVDLSLRDILKCCCDR